MADIVASLVGLVCLLLATLMVYIWHDPHPELRPLPTASPFVKTGVWLRLQELRGRELTTIHDLHRRLGPIIRLSRDAIGVASDSPELRSIHTKAQSARKSAQYEDLLITFHKPVFGLLDAQEHAARRAGFGRTYTRSLDYRDIVGEMVVRHLKIMEGQHVEAVDIFWSAVIKCNQELVFGASQREPSVESYDQIRRQRCGEAIGHGSPVPRLRLIGLLPRWFRRRLRSRIPRTRGAEWVDEGIAAATKNIKTDTPCSRIQQHFQTEIETENRGKPLSSEQERELSQRLRDEMVDQLTGGTDFPISVLTCALHMLAQPEHQHWQDRLAEPGEDNVAAVVNELLRLFPPAAGSQPRELLQPITLPYQAGSITLQPGVNVHAQPFTLHRSAEKFADPESFRPERWLPDGDAKPSDLWAFGKGPTHCIAQEYAMKVTKTMLKVACETARFDAVETGPLDGKVSQSLLLSIPEGVKVRVRLRW